MKLTLKDVMEVGWLVGWLVDCCGCCKRERERERERRDQTAANVNLLSIVLLEMLKVGERERVGLVK